MILKQSYARLKRASVELGFLFPVKFHLGLEIICKLHVIFTIFPRQVVKKIARTNEAKVFGI